ncbi:Glycosyl transferase family 8, partial [Trinorchestia longiramus]
QEVVFLLILCEVDEQDEGMDVARDVTRQLQQAHVLLKSAVALTISTLRFVVVADSEKLYSDLVSPVSAWPPQYREKLSFEYLPVWYPPERAYMRTLFRECATERLFVPSMLPQEDAVIYIDTDFIFMTPPEDLWAEFYHFDAQHTAAMAPCLYHYGTSRNSKVPYYGRTGLNAGVMHMNLTRMKTFPGGGWLEANMAVFDEYRDNITLADQDILNILFNKHPDLVYELSCAWNYRPFQCRSGVNECPVTSEVGVALLHGNALAFASDREPKIKVTRQAVYDTWKAFELGTSLAELYEALQRRLAAVPTKGTHCSSLPNIDEVLSLQLLRHLQQ